MTVILPRPIDMVELPSVYDTDLRLFPPRLLEQPIFYGVLHSRYARQIRCDWDAKSRSFVGYVMRFEVDGDYASRFDRHIVGRVGAVRGAWSEAYLGVPLTIKA